MALSDEVKAGSTVELTEEEEREVEERSPPRAVVVFETVRREGELELRRPALSLAASGYAAGLSMGASLAGEGLLRAMLPDAKWRPLVDSFGYSLGFVFVILGRQQLFTENTLTAILPLLDNPEKLKTLWRVMRLWAVVLATNLLGAACFAVAIAHLPFFSDAVRTTFLQLGQEAAAPSFITILIRGVAAGYLIALMVWLLPFSDVMRPFVIILVTWAVGVASFSHIIAGSVEVLYVVASGHLSGAAYLQSYLLPVFIGNVIGGTSLVALLNYGQIVAEGNESRQS
ncbi:MAG: formate/nitrite transporter family protein [Candidatus Eremiobacteraeota bacterium]|nr:formate/nitrite transporter family protein [Candidatus Eremiobacteraeota bacterium]MBC5802788.1 formate/nitrite transporter family protein [Candidatus Eremiobacteraeota bacterium]MBC5820549.1 formate/nitrite transporter family protein [Candidatus Eremiobacteraeota bacterium]